MNNLKDRLLAALEFHVDQECGQWEIPIDDLNGELTTRKRAARFIEVVEAAPIASHYARTRALVEAMVGCISEAHAILTLTHPELSNVEMNTLTTRQYMLWDREALTRVTEALANLEEEK